MRQRDPQWHSRGMGPKGCRAWRLREAGGSETHPCWWARQARSTASGQPSPVNSGSSVGCTYHPTDNTASLVKACAGRTVCEQLPMTESHEGRS